MSLGPGEAFDHICYSDLGTTSHSHSSVVLEIKKRTVRCLAWVVGKADSFDLCRSDG